MIVAANNKHLIKPSDAVAWDYCIRRVWFDNRELPGIDIEPGPFDQLVMERGLLHEKKVLKKLAKRHSVTIAKDREDTQRLMALGTEIIYQAQLYNEQLGLIGFPDFLIRHESGEYRAADAKLAFSSAKKAIQIQLGCYRRLLANDQPAIVFLGDGAQEEISDETDPLTSRFMQEMAELLHQPSAPEVNYSHSRCKACPYYSQCRPDFEKEGNLSLVYGIDGRALPGLHAQGITDIDQLAATDPKTIKDVPYLKGADKQARAVLQAKARITGELYYIKPLSIAPEESETWVHFDIEDNPLTPDGNKHVYLWGFLVPDYETHNFEYVWTDNQDQDFEGWQNFLSLVTSYRSKYANLKLIHFSRHERTTIAQYAERYDMLEDSTVQWLLSKDGPLLDLQIPVKECLVLPLDGYDLKSICKHPKLVNFQWQDDDSGSQWSVVQFNAFLETTDRTMRESLKQAILGYNRDDVMATRKLEEWLRGLSTPAN